MGSKNCQEPASMKGKPHDINCPSVKPGLYGHITVNKRLNSQHFQDPPLCRNGRRPHDVLFPCLTPGKFAHIAKQPNTNHLQKSYEHTNKMHRKFVASNIDEQIKKDLIDIKSNVHAEKRRFQRQVQDRYNEKIREYENSIDNRREKLRDLLARDEQEFYYVAVDEAQRGGEMKMEQMKAEAAKLRARREEERLELVKAKRIQQYKERCVELRPALANKHLKESKYTQLQQIRENELRRESERELERMWYNMMQKENEAKIEREIQDALSNKNIRNDLLETWNMQVQGKELAKKEELRTLEEDKIEMIKLQEELQKEAIEEARKKLKLKEQRAKELREQMEVTKKFEEIRKKEEKALDDAFNRLAEIELEKEKAAVVDYTTQAKRETAMYRKHLKELEASQKREEDELMKSLEAYRQVVEQEQLEAKCKAEAAREKLQREVLQGRAEQIEYKQKQLEKQREAQAAENKLIQMAYATNACLKKAKEKMMKDTVRNYSNDLMKQIQYNGLLKQREKEELEREILEAEKEEERYQKFVEELIHEGISEGDVIHPFRMVLEKSDCRCCPKKKPL